MDISRDEQYQLTCIKMARWTKLAKSGGGNAGGETGEKTDKVKKEKEVVVADTTPAGEKKDMSKPMNAEYHPKSVEAAWYAWWEKKNFFGANADPVIKKTKTPYTMVIPPPNVTGALHLGHALMLSIEDALIIQKRMKGLETLCVPGCDHAGIAT